MAGNHSLNAQINEVEFIFNARSKSSDSEIVYRNRVLGSALKTLQWFAANEADLRAAVTEIKARRASA